MGKKGREGGRPASRERATVIMSGRGERAGKPECSGMF